MIEEASSMKHPSQCLKEEIDHLLGILSQDDLLPIPTETKLSFVTRAMDLSTRLKCIENGLLTVGLIGGTGVGKSTLMNALAGSEIASTSHRRAHTDRVLIYRHVTTDLPPTMLETGAPHREIAHQAENINRLLLCDLPDFDSFKQEHRQYVLDFMKCLDLLVWVTSPEKYADGRFYDFIQRAPKDVKNYCFVLNKADLFFRSQPLKMGRRQRAAVVGHFVAHLKGKGIQDPRIYVLSAAEGVGSSQVSSWNELTVFREHILQQWDIKETAEIKASNLDVEVQRLLNAFQEHAVKPEVIDTLLEKLVNELSGYRAEWLRAGREMVDNWLESPTREEFLMRLDNPAHLIGPGRDFAMLARRCRGCPAPWNKVPVVFSPTVLAEEVNNSIRERAAWLEDLIQNRVFGTRLPTSVVERLRDVWNASDVSKDLTARLGRILDARRKEPLWPSWKHFRMSQWISYVLLWLFFLVAFLNQVYWQELAPHLGGVLMRDVAVAILKTLFSVTSLAAVACCALLYLFLGFRFHCRHQELIGRRAQELTQALKVESMKEWELQWDTLIARLVEMRRTNIPDQY